MALVGWILLAGVASLVLAMFALPWLSIFRPFVGSATKSEPASTEVLQLRAEPAELAAKHALHGEGDQDAAASTFGSPPTPR